MERNLLVIWCILLGLCALVQAQSGNGSNSTYGSGSGSGSGDMPVAQNCSSLECSHGCNESARGAACYCPIGYILEQDMMTCRTCPGGLYGVGCSSECDCSPGNTCDRISGECSCNLCYSGARCDTPGGYECFVQFLGIPDKSMDNLRNFYGASFFPTPPSNHLLDLIASGIMEVPSSFISGEQFEVINRSSVGQGPLVKLSWWVNKALDRVTADRALSGLSDKVKLGDIRATYIAQDLADNTLVTINAGVKVDPV